MTYRIPRNVAHTVREEPDGQPVVHLMRLPVGRPLVLRGTAAWIWLLATEGSEDVVPALAEMLGCQPDSLAADTESFMRDLVSRGLLEEDQP